MPESATCPKCGEPVSADTASDERVVCPHCTSVLTFPGKCSPSDPVDPLLGEKLGEYEILALLGRGGMGAVYKAQATDQGGLVAVKVLPRNLARNPNFVARFEREASDAAAVRHPNIVQVFHVGRERDYPYIVMELVDGESLAAILRRRGRLPAEGAVDLMKQVLSGLVTAHAAGVVHRDIKPSNILVTARGVAKLADFGLAKRPGVDASLTLTGDVLGTPLYLPPEGVRGDKLDARSDLYSLGATFYEVLAGRPPFVGRTVTELLLKQVQDKPPHLAHFVENVPPGLCRIVHRLLQKNPADRFRSAQLLLQVLSREETLGHRPRPAEPPPPLPAPPMTGGHREHAPAPGPSPQPTGPPPLPETEGPKTVLPAEGVLRGHRRMALLLGGLAALLASAGYWALHRPPGGETGPRVARPATGPSTTPKTSTAPETSTAPGQGGKWRVYKEWPFSRAEAKRRQEETAATLGVPVRSQITLGGGVGLALVLIPAGEFIMGSEHGLPDERPTHRVRLDRPFYLSVHPVTQAHYFTVMRRNPSRHSGPALPVEMVSWREAREFCGSLPAVPGGGVFRLPTEAEWEYACRAGSAEAYWSGDSEALLDPCAWFWSNSGLRTHDVGIKKPNAWGLFDLHGNVWQWCSSLFRPYPCRQDDGREESGLDGTRVLRGGSYARPADECRSASRSSGDPTYGDPQTGFRVARDVP